MYMGIWLLVYKWQITGFVGAQELPELSLFYTFFKLLYKQSLVLKTRIVGCLVLLQSKNLTPGSGRKIMSMVHENLEFILGYCKVDHKMKYGNI